MNAQPNVPKLIQQTQRYEFSDGLRDFQLALMIAAMGILNWAIFDHLDLWLKWTLDLGERFGVAGRWLPLLMVFIPGAVTLLALLVMRFVRRRWLWRDSGYVKPKTYVVPRRISVISAIILIPPMLVGILLQAQHLVEGLFFLRLLLIASGWSFAYTLIALGRLLNLPRFVYVGVVGGIVTTPLLFLTLTVGQTGLWWGLMWGAALTVSGVSALRNKMNTIVEAQHE